MESLGKSGMTLVISHKKIGNCQYFGNSGMTGNKRNRDSLFMHENNQIEQMY